MTAMMTSGCCAWHRIRNGVIRSVGSTRVETQPLFKVTKSAGTVTESTRSAFMGSAIVTDQAVRRRKGTERGGTERKRRDVTSRLAGKKKKNGVNHPATGSEEGFPFHFCKKWKAACVHLLTVADLLLLLLQTRSRLTS